jgi:UDPglucose 6-dehydrogenase
MTITIVGHGYVGLVSAAIFADLGNTTWCLGRHKEKIDEIIAGKMPFFEPGLEEIVTRNIKAGRLKFSTDYSKAIPDSEIVFICVGTPPKETGDADLTQVFASAKEIAKNLDGYTVVVTKSTVPVGTNSKVGEILEKEKPKKAIFNIASCPEFLREGTALSDTLHPDRVVIGVDSEKAKELLLELHKPIGGERVITNIETSEMIKYASNSMLSVKISFANAMSFLCEKVGADVEKVMDGIGLDRRIGRRFLYPGVGYGGSCFPKDVKALVATAKIYGYDFKLLKEVDAINKQAASDFVEKVVRLLGGSVKGKTLGILGLAFKPNTDDMREAPSIKIITALLEKGAKIKAFDPVAVENAKTILKDVEYAKDSYDTAKDSDGVLIITEWNEFKQLDLLKVKTLMKTPIIIDGRNIYDPDTMKKLGFTYKGVGR